MTRGRADTKACERRQKAEAREAAMEARQSGTSAMATVSRRPRSLDAQGSPEQHDGSRRSPVLSLREFCVPGVGDPPGSHRTHLPPMTCGWGAANPASPNGSPGQRDRYR